MKIHGRAWKSLGSHHGNAPVLIAANQQSDWVGVTAAEVIFWFAIAALVIAGRLYVVSGPRLGNDSYQYLSVASNFTAGDFAKTSIVHFDTERSHGKIPAPVTTFPIGYPITIALLEGVGLSVVTAALVISVVSSWLLVPLMLWCARWMEWPRAVTHSILALLVGNSLFSDLSTAVYSDSLFTAVTFFSVLAFLRAGNYEDADRRRGFWVLVACIAIGFSYWIRYAGLFLFGAAWIYYGLCWIRTRNRRSWQMIGGLMVSSAIISTGLIRNQVLVDSWMGGNTKHMHRDLFEVGRKFVVTIYHLLFGSATARFGVAKGVCFVSAIVVIGVVSRELWKNNIIRSVLKTAEFVAVFLVIYTATFLYLAATSVISFIPRMLYPLLPCLLMLVGIVVRRPAITLMSTHRLAAAAVLAGFTLSYAIINFGSYTARVPEMPDQRVTLRLGEEMTNGTPLREWIEDHVAKEEIIVVAGDGQATAYILKRRTVSLVSPDFSDLLWTEKAVQDTMMRFNAQYLIVSRRDDPDSPLIASTPFLLGLAFRQFPRWVRLVAENDSVLVYKRS